MYTPHQFKGNLDSVSDFIKKYPFGIIASHNGKRIEATHLPFVLEDTGGKLELFSHLASVNPQWKSFEKEAVLVIFSEPHAYISPKHYSNKENVPTWNYVSTHLYGKVSIFKNEKENTEILEKMIAFFEATFKFQWDNLSKEYQQVLLNEIVGIKIEVTEIQFQEKLSQNKAKSSRNSMIDEFSKSDSGHENELANYMSKKDINNRKMTTDQAFTNNRNWVSEKLSLDENYFENLSKGQSPDFLYIGCSDSRVSPELMMGAEPGNVFVTRNIANVVSNLDVSSKSVINYAVEHLGVKHAVVCGHYYCGGVKAAMTSSDLGIINPWLQNIRDVYRLHKTELDAISNEEERYRKLVDLNVHEQCINLLNNPDVQKAVKAGELKVHGWVFDIKTGGIIDLNFNMDDNTLAEIYSIA